MRITRDQWAIEMAQVTAKRSTCMRRAVGCVLLNKFGHVLSTGYNGVARGRPHCNQNGFKRNLDMSLHLLKTEPPLIPLPDYFPHACSGSKAESGTNLDACQAIHAEQNALLQCRDAYQIAVAYVTASPCITCTKLLLNTSCQRIVFVEEYPQPEARKLWVDSGRLWQKYGEA